MTSSLADKKRDKILEKNKSHYLTLSDFNFDEISLLRLNEYWAIPLDIYILLLLSLDVLKHYSKLFRKSFLPR